MTRFSKLLTLAPLICLPFGAMAQTAADSFSVIELDGKPFAAKASLTLPVDGKIQGQGPCNRFFAEVSGDLTSLTVGPIAATKMACPDLAVESALFQALEGITRGERQPDGTVILFDDKGPRLTLAPAE